MKSFLAIVMLALFASVASADSSIYIKSLPLAKITASTKGYRVVYLTESGNPRVIYVPMQWFYQTGGFTTDDGHTKAELFLGRDLSYPYVQFFWKDGAFHHVRIYAIADKSDVTWGLSETEPDVSAKFDPAKPLDLKF